MQHFFKNYRLYYYLEFTKKTNNLVRYLSNCEIHMYPTQFCKCIYLLYKLVFMKLPSICESKWLLMVGFAFILPLLGGCQEDGLPDDEGAEVSLKRVPTNPNYALLPLIGTKWKLVGFADGKKRMIKLAKPAEGYCFLLIFREQGVLDGYASTNRIRGEYIIESAKENRIKITYFGLVDRF